LGAGKDETPIAFLVIIGAFATRGSLWFFHGGVSIPRPGERTQECIKSTGAGELQIRQSARATRGRKIENRK
jgi:hypothetical protein